MRDAIPPEYYKLFSDAILVNKFINEKRSCYVFSNNERWIGLSL